MKFDWKKALKTTLLLTALGTIVAILSNKNSYSFEDWIESASDDELSDGYEQRRQQLTRFRCLGQTERQVSNCFA